MSFLLWVQCKIEISKCHGKPHKTFYDKLQASNIWLGIPFFSFLHLESKFTHEHGLMDDVSFIFQGQKSQVFSTLGGMNVNME